MGAHEIKLMGSGNEQRDWLLVSDAAALMIALVKTAPIGCGPVNLGCGQAVSVHDAANEFVRAISPDVPVSFSGVRAAGDPDMLVADTTKLKDILTVKGAPPLLMPPNPLKSFGEVAQWYKNAWDEDVPRAGNAV
ncbi:hypothetical protein ACERZ8_21320 [Tateyamaria armeniaca]|uniref:NAD-dependent epimerase/dehydratase domain-containing protein n=1 Tax=Tateyamaria armeniaca TaxID=2518930 RepID=A0ABW8UZ09_9RHOB